MDKIIQILGDGFFVSILGMGTVFVVLFALIFSIWFINRLVRSNKKSEESNNISKVEQKVEETATASLDGTEELIAVITAAVAASLNRSTHSIVVRSVTRIPGSSPVWNQAGRYEQIASKL